MSRHREPERKQVSKNGKMKARERRLTTRRDRTEGGGGNSKWGREREKKGKEKTQQGN